MTAPTAIQINTNQIRGRRSGTFSGQGTRQLRFQSDQPFAPGELVSLTVPASVSTPAQVVQFYAATGRAAATFSAPVAIGPPPSSQPAVVAAGDVDNDGDIDLVAGETNSATLCRNNGAGQFTTITNSGLVAPRASELQLADVNGDGNLDVLSSALTSPVVYLSLGTGQGTFQPRTTLVFPNFQAELATGDFNADGIIDVVVGEPVSTGMSLRFFPGVPTGNLTQTQISSATLPGRDLGVADMDEDGDLDLLLVSDALLGIYLNDGTGQFTPGSTVAVNVLSGKLTVGDFTGDGHADVVCSSSQTANATLAAGTGTGNWQPIRNVSALSRNRYARSGDMDGDGDLDLLVTNDRGITQVLLNNGAGLFSAAAAVLFGWEQFTMADAADLNGDGLLDVYTGHQVSNPSMPYGIDIFFNQPLITTASSHNPTLAFAVFPNPAREQLVVQVPPGTEFSMIEVRDALGRLVRAQAGGEAESGRRLVDLQGLAPGRYAVIVYTNQLRGTRWMEVY